MNFSGLLLLLSSFTNFPHAGFLRPAAETAAAEAEVGWIDESWAFKLTGEIDRSGEVAQCSLELEGNPPSEVRRPNCDFGLGIPVDVLDAVRSGKPGAPSKVVALIALTIDDQYPELAKPQIPATNIIRRLVTSFRIQASGSVVGCKVVEAVRISAPKESLCLQPEEFSPTKGGRTRLATMTMVTYVE